MGNVEVRVAHTPGHTPDSICLFVTDHARSPEPWFVLTGDLLFVGSVGRPDLGGATAAEDIWSSLQRVLLPLDDSVEIYPAHGAGSSCGKAMSAKSGSTIGFERRFNPAFRFDDKSAFVDFIMAGIPAKPAAFDKIVAKNRGLVPLVAAKPRPYAAREAWEAIERGRLRGRPARRGRLRRGPRGGRAQRVDRQPAVRRAGGRPGARPARRCC